MISEILDGLAILKTVNPDAPIVSAAYRIMVPKILQGDLDGAQQAAIEAANWVLDPVYGCYHYPAETIVELANVTGEGDNEMPPLPTVLLPLPVPPLPPPPTP